MFTKNLPIRYDKIGDKKYKIQTVEHWSEITIQQVQQEIEATSTGAQAKLDELALQIDALEALDE